MTKVEATQAQEKFSELLALVEEGQERIVIESEGQVVAAVISYADLKRLEALEDAIDVADFRRAVTESNAESYSVEEVIADYNKLHNTDFTVENILND
ncbi:type II toxin-antitoxin system Phd/YefM family antitoxin [Hassallia byssoidea VB512170]|uniref:Antitoxin n=1 Tax=Hassallia byssoidea VB512170 TaxID=1304833 RepID=A0A846H7G2_9CYAN|nr:type II toxin-antitoxin system Phd/YefM family antitoxin [Hassalia byssoidea]NEU72461.1 type II toxin-antitoxin system Phd/YefM family antitoxin [Hassalia byssoidea VB512170]